MSVSTLAHPGTPGKSQAKFWLGILLVIAAGIGLAWLGAGSLRGQTTASGLQIRTVQQGTGPFIKEMDGALIEYEGRLTDGTVFDSSGERGPQPVIPAQMIPGFREALTLMQQGGSYRLLIPSKLAYGAKPPAGAPIPPNADLEFDVEVSQVVPNAALMVQQQMQQQQSGEGTPQAR